MCPSSSPWDIVPTTFLKIILPVLGPDLLAIINSSLTSGSVPDLFKIASVQPLLKKSSLEPNQIENYRPISKLPFLSKILEKIVADQHLKLVEGHRISDQFQSGFRQKHSTETALLRVSNDIMHADKGESSILIFLDLTAAFDTIDHAIFLVQPLIGLIPIWLIESLMSALIIMFPLPLPCCVVSLRGRFLVQFCSPCTCLLWVICSAASMTCQTTVMRMIHKSTFLRNPITWINCPLSMSA